MIHLKDSVNYVGMEEEKMWGRERDREVDDVQPHGKLIAKQMDGRSQDRNKAKVDRSTRGDSHRASNNSRLPHSAKPPMNKHERVLCSRQRGLTYANELLLPLFGTEEVWRREDSGGSERKRDILLR